VKRRLCILLVSHWSAQSAGAELQVKALLEKLIATDSFDIHYVARKIDASYQPEGYLLHRVPARRQISGYYLLDVPGVVRLLERVQPDVIYQRVASAYTAAAAYFARKNNRRLVWHISSDRDLMPRPWRLSWRSSLEQLNQGMIEYGARRADVVIVQNAQQAALLRKYYGRSDAVHIPNFHPAPVTPIVKATDRIVVCWVANIKPLKQPELFVRLASDLRHRSDVEFVIVGAQQMNADAWRGLLASMRDLQNLRYVGPQSHSAVEQLMASAHLLVNTSTIEGFPNTFIQAWLREVPVVSLSVNPDGVFDADRYGICARGSYDRLRDAVEQLIADSSLRRQIGERASAFARERFTERNIEQIIPLLGSPP
jgi:glycosyltransferase involved in cell wall biosynthesis